MLPVCMLPAQGKPLQRAGATDKPRKGHGARVLQGSDRTWSGSAELQEAAIQGMAHASASLAASNGGGQVSGDAVHLSSE